jgi:hypothetical protein
MREGFGSFVCAYFLSLFVCTNRRTFVSFVEPHFVFVARRFAVVGIAKEK